MAKTGNIQQGKPTQEGSLYYTDLEDRFAGTIIEEFFTNIVKGFILYWQIDEERSEISEVYGETTKRIFKNPIKIYCMVDFEEPENRINKFGIDTQHRITCYIHRRRMEELNIRIDDHDYIEYGGLTYKIVSSIDSRYIGNISKFKDTIIVKGVSIDQVNRITT